jgi:hypothetical protein
MGYLKRRQIKFRQRFKRQKKRLKLKEKGLDPDDFYNSGIWIGPLKKDRNF